MTDAERSLKPSQAATLITIAGVGRLRVTCSAHPAARFALTPFAAGEGPPTIIHDTEQTHAQTSLAGFTRQYQLSVPTREAVDQTLQHWQIDGGGEAFQFAVHITALLTPTVHRCDLLATATTVTHGPFYRYAHTRPAAPRNTGKEQTVDGISIKLPRGWTLRRDPVPALVEPSLPFAVGSWPLPSGGNGCAPSRAINSQPANAALLWLYEYAPGHFRKADFPPQPTRFRLGRLGGPYECVGVRAYKILFRSHDRYFQVHVILGTHADRLRGAVIAALSSLRVEPAR